MIFPAVPRPLEAALVARTQELGRRFRIALAERQFALLLGAVDLVIGGTFLVKRLR
jgi:hypothetical protein